MKKHILILLSIALSLPISSIAVPSEKTRWQKLKDRFDFEYIELNKCVRRHKDCDPTRRAFYLTAGMIIIYLMGTGIYKVYKSFTRVRLPEVEGPQSRQPVLTEEEIELLKKGKQLAPEQPQKVEPVAQLPSQVASPVSQEAPEKKEAQPEQPIAEARQESKKEEESESEGSDYESAEEEDIDEKLARETTEYDDLAKRITDNLKDIEVNIYGLDIQQSQNFYQQALAQKDEWQKGALLQKSVDLMKDVLQKILEGLYNKFSVMAETRLNTSISERVKEQRNIIKNDIESAQKLYNEARNVDFYKKILTLEMAIEYLKRAISDVDTIEHQEKGAR